MEDDGCGWAEKKRCDIVERECQELGMGVRRERNGERNINIAGSFAPGASIQLCFDCPVDKPLVLSNK